MRIPVNRLDGAIASKPKTTANLHRTEPNANTRESRSAGGVVTERPNTRESRVGNPYAGVGNNFKGVGSDHYTQVNTHKKKKHHHHKHKKVTHAHQTPKKPAAKPDAPAGDNTTAPSTLGLYGYRWNLPPHKWSLPVEADDMSKYAANSVPWSLGSSGKYRRGRIYWYSRVNTSYTDGSTYNTGSYAKGNDHSKDPRYGFQFIWNPQSVATSVAVNMDITPSFADKFVDVVGAFPSGEYLTLSLMLDRTNDFACIRSIPTDQTQITPAYEVGTDQSIVNNTTAKTANVDVYKDLADQYVKYYDGSLSFDVGTPSTSIGYDTASKIYDLQRYGTIADLEYLYKAINGPGWSNIATGQKSSDIGFLSPTLLRIDIGPLSYLGYVNNLTVNHIAFTKGMIPIRTEVNLQFNLMATAGLSSK
jgi:hypothetical protein